MQVIEQVIEREIEREVEQDTEQVLAQGFENEAEQDLERSDETSRGEPAHGHEPLDLRDESFAVREETDLSVAEFGTSARREARGESEGAAEVEHEVPSIAADATSRNESETLTLTEASLPQGRERFVRFMYADGATPAPAAVFNSPMNGTSPETFTASSGVSRSTGFITEAAVPTNAPIQSGFNAEFERMKSEIALFLQRILEAEMHNQAGLSKMASEDFKGACFHFIRAAEINSTKADYHDNLSKAVVGALAAPAASR
jgi:hypothetical protein